MKTLIAAALLGLGSRAYAQLATICPSSNICYKLNIPANTASSGDGDIFFQISAPTSLSWVALGQGSSMAGANIFVVYISGDGKNVTVSPRLGKGHVEPNYNKDAQISLLEGSGVINGKMVANVKCSNCKSWSGGSMDFKSSSGSWIYASKSGAALNTDNKEASINQHGGDAAAFNWDFSQAKGGSSVNPLASGSVATASASCKTRTSSAAGGAAATATWPTTVPASATAGWPTSWPASWLTAWPTARPSGSPWSAKRDDGDNDDGEYCDSATSNPNNVNGNQFTLIASEQQRQQRMLIAHGVLAALAFVILFPIGAISIRLFSFPGLVWFHGLFQIFGYLVYIAAFGLGIYLATQLNYLNEYHPIIGILLFILLFFQPILGFCHHLSFKKYGRRTFSSYGHLWLGRIIITLGIINGGLGLLLADNSKTRAVAYGVIAGVVWLVYVAAAIIGESRRTRDAPPKYSESQASSPPTGGPAAPPQHGYFAPPKH